jgi:hypothetical protein
MPIQSTCRLGFSSRLLWLVGVGKMLPFAGSGLGGRLFVGFGSLEGGLMHKNVRFRPLGKCHSVMGRLLLGTQCPPRMGNEPWGASALSGVSCVMLQS